MVSKRFDKIAWSIIIFLTFAFSAFFLTNSVVNTASAANTDVSTGDPDFSYSKMSEAGAQFLLKVYSNKDFEALTDISYPLHLDSGAAGKAGGLLGYVDPNSYDTGGSVGTNSLNATVYSREFLKSLGQQSESDIQSQTYAGSPAAAYQAYGQVLHDTGLDEVVFGGSANADSGRQFIGWIYKLAYLLALMLSVFFNLIFTILGYANPFRLFATSESKIPNGGNINIGSVNSGAGNGGVAAIAGSMDTGIAGLQALVAGFYDTLKSMSLFVILPVTLAITLFMLLVWKKGTGIVATLKDYVIKLAFTVIGLPLMFACYSTAIDLMGDFTVAENTVATKVVLSTFCNFEDWAKVNLDASLLKKGFSTNVETGTVANKDSIEAVRHVCFNINKYILHTSVSGIGDVGVDNETFHSQLLKESNTKEFARRGGDSSSGSVSIVIGLLDSYSQGSTFSAGDYATYRDAGPKLTLPNGAGAGMYIYGGSQTMSQDVKNHIAFSTISTHPDGYSKDTVTDYMTELGTAVVEVDAATVETWVTGRFTGSPLKTIWSDGTLTGVRGGSGQMSSGSWIIIKDDASGHLSTMSMYNYLSSSFENGAVVVYSTDNSASESAKCEHYSVTAVGTGILELVYLVDGLVLLAAISVVGYMYGFSLLMSNFKAMFKLVPNVLTGMLGSKGGIASALILTAAMIIEVVGTCLVYSLVNELLFAIYSLIEVPIVQLLDTLTLGGTAFATVVADVYPILAGVLSIVIIWQFICYALRWRYAIVMATTEAATEVVNKFIGASVAAPNISMNPNDMSTKIGAAASAAGMGIMAAKSMGHGDEIDGYKNSFAESLGIDNKSDGTTKKVGAEIGSGTEGHDGKVTETNEHGVKYGSGTSGIAEHERAKGESKLAENTAAETGDGTKNVTGQGENKSAEEGNGTSNIAEHEQQKGEEYLAKIEAAEGNSNDTNVDASIDKSSETNVNAEAAAEAADSTSDGDESNALVSDSDVPKDSAERYIQENRETFLSSIEGNDTQATIDPETGEITLTNPETGEKSVVNPNTGEVSVVNADGSKTALNDVKYDSETGKLVAVDNVTGSESTVGALATDTSTDKVVQLDARSDGSLIAPTNTTGSTITMMDSQGNTAEGYQLVNSITGNPYTESDMRNNAPYSIVNGEGKAYTDSNGVTYSNMSSYTLDNGGTQVYDPSTNAALSIKPDNGGSVFAQTQPAATNLQPGVVIVGSTSAQPAATAAAPAASDTHNTTVINSHYDAVAQGKSDYVPASMSGSAPAPSVPSGYGGTNVINSHYDAVAQGKSDYIPASMGGGSTPAPASVPAPSAPSGYGGTTVQGMQPAQSAQTIINNNIEAGVNIDTNVAPTGGSSGTEGSVNVAGISLGAVAAAASVAQGNLPTNDGTGSKVVNHGDTIVNITTEHNAADTTIVSGNEGGKPAEKDDENGDLLAGLSDKLNFGGALGSVFGAGVSHMVHRSKTTEKTTTKKVVKKEKNDKKS